MFKLSSLQHIREKKNGKSESFVDVSDKLMNWIKRSGEKDLEVMKDPIQFKENPNCYKYVDHSAVLLFIGKRRSGKTNLMFAMARQLQKADPGRIICLWRSPRAKEKVEYLKSVGITAIAVEEIEEIPYNGIVLIDEGIINANAKLALTKLARSWDMYQVIVSHKRAILMLTFQRWEIFASFTEMADATFYKRLGSKLANRAKDDPFLKEHKDFIKKLEKSQALVESDLDGFEETGLISVDKPKWYNSLLSEGYKDANLDFEMSDVQKRQNQIDDVALELIGKGFKPNPANKKYYFALISKIRREYIKHRFNNSEINSIIQRMYEIMVFEPEKMIDAGMSKEEFDELKNMPKPEDVEQKDLDDALIFANGQSSSKFDMNKVSLMAKMRKVMLFLLNSYYAKSLADKEGNKHERLIANRYLDRGDYVMRALGSGGFRGQSKYPQPDFFHILTQGELRVVQVKTRSETSETFQPGTFKAELEIIEFINENIPSLKGRFKPYLYFLPKGRNPTETWEIPLKPEFKEKVLFVDFDRKQIEVREPRIIAEVKSEPELQPVAIPSDLKEISHISSSSIDLTKKKPEIKRSNTTEIKRK